MPNRFYFAIVILFAGWMAGCIAFPVPVATKTTAPPALDNKIDLSFLQRGKTTQKDVQDNLGWSDSGIKAPKLFVGRWSTSSTATVWAVGAQYSGNAGAYRNWGVKTLVVEFDDQGLLRSWRFVPDREFVQALAPYAAEAVPHNAFEKPSNLEISHVKRGQLEPVTLTISKEVMLFREHASGKHDFDIAPQKIERITIPGLKKSEQEFPDRIRFTIHFPEETKAGREVTFEASPADLMTMLAYHILTKPTP